MRFEMIDRVTEQTADRLVGLRSVTLAEEYLGDHFPGFPVLPGVLMFEALVQGGRRLAESLDPSPGQGRLVVREARNVRYGGMVRPGDTLRVEVVLKGRSERGWDFTGVGSVGERVTVQGRFVLDRLGDDWALGEHRDSRTA